jgi:hypothetical protein
MVHAGRSVLVPDMDEQHPAFDYSDLQRKRQSREDHQRALANQRDPEIRVVLYSRCEHVHHDQCRHILTSMWERPDTANQTEKSDEHKTIWANHVSRVSGAMRAVVDPSGIYVTNR